ncbi:SDR family oxidoreductase [Pelagibacterium lentulum]|uniref:NAD(P)-dependent oxidoreductase n=1 Tax=Pelagibacterium lentulum TaxID=2029865 RepID=A0A916R749_9HYPH|nr:SDR family oxidoreductase [Pelagibacterium lentulum]GGA39323.1 NAD(P)-dependent oxidoreductase [Pelagibacterium lentulum]
MILVTGASGTIGQILIETLLAQGFPFRAAYHNPAKATAARARGIETAIIDMHQPETLPPALEAIETVFLLGSGVRAQEEMEINLVEVAKTAGASRIVKLSAWAAPQEQYRVAGIHRAVERHIEASGLAWTFLRPNGFMQNFLHMAEQIRAQGAIYMPAGDALISHVDARDIARVASKILTDSGHEGKAYELSGPAALGYADVAAILSRSLGRPITYVAVEDTVAQEAMIADGMPEFYAEAMIDLFRVYRTGIAAAISNAVEDITGSPATPFARFVQNHRAVFGIDAP